jgi:hypothetical protein
MKNLKRKVAFLLALVMVLSLVPAMNARALEPGEMQPGVSSRMTRAGGTGLNDFYGVGSRAFFPGGNQLSNFEFTIDSAWFDIPTPLNANGMQGITIGGVPNVQVYQFAIEAVVSGRDTDPYRYSGITDFGLFNATVPTPNTWGALPTVYTSPRANPDFTDANAADRGFGLARAAVNVAATPSSIVVRGTVNVTTPNATVSLYLRSVYRDSDGVYTAVRTQLARNVPLVRALPGVEAPAAYNGLTMSRYGSAVNLHRFAPAVTRVPQLRITEYRVGSFMQGDQLIVRLDAPPGFQWAIDATPPAANAANNTTINVVFEGSLAERTLNVPAHSAVPGVGPNSATTGTAINGFVGIETNVLEFPVDIQGRRPGAAATALGQLRITGLRLVPSAFGTTHADNTNFNVIASVIGNNAAGESIGAGVGQRLHVRGGNPIHVATYRRQGILLEPVGTPTQLTAGRNDQVVAGFRITELAPNSFPLYPANVPFSVLIDHPGVTLASARYWVFNAGDDRPADGYARTAASPINNLLMHTVATRGHVNYQRAVEFELTLNIAPGFALNPTWSNTISAEVNVFNINPLAAGNTHVTLGVVRDPISLSAGTPTQLQIHGDPFGAIFPVQLPRISIHEAYAGAIAAGERLYVYMVPTIGPLVFNDPFGNLGLTRVPVPTVTGCPNFLLSTGVALAPGQGSNDSQFTKIAYTVHRASDSPVTINFDGTIIEGLVTSIPGLEISFAVGGGAVIDNWDSDIATVVPYRVAVAHFEQPIQVGPTPTPPGHTPTPPPTPTPTPQVRQVTMSPDGDFRGQPNPIRTVPGVGDVIAIRAFIYLLERNAASSELIHFTSVDAPIIVNARNSNDVWIQFQFRIGSTQAYRNGVPFTLQSAPQHIGARVYLPASIIADVFGFQAQRNALDGSWTFQ